MTEDEHDWQEKEWERYIDTLLSTHFQIFGGSYQTVPDLNGDCGLEGFTDTGEAFQSYADQKSKNNKARTKKQKEKITDDLNKLEEYKVFWGDVFGKNKLKRWTLMVPNHDDKQVMRHAKKEARRIIGLGLPFIDGQFIVDVKTDQDYAVARQYIRMPQAPKIPTEEVTDQHVKTFTDSQPQFIKNIRRKLKKVRPTATKAQLDALIKEWLTWHLKSANYLEGLRGKIPEFWEDVQEIVNATADEIKTEECLDGRAPKSRLKETRSELDETLTKQATFLSFNDRKAVSFGTVAKWLGECPLDFAEVTDV